MQSTVNRKLTSADLFLGFNLSQANEFKENRELFLHKAKEYTERYATGHGDSLAGGDRTEASRAYGPVYLIQYWKGREKKPNIYIIMFKPFPWRL